MMRPLHGWMLLVLGAVAVPLQAQAGGGGAAGAGAGAGSSGPGAGAAAAQAAPAAHAGAANAAPPNGVPAAAYQAEAIGPDPRRPPASRPGAYTLDQLLALARDHNPTLLAAEANLRAVRAAEVQAGVRANPYLTVYGTDVTEGNTASTPYNVSVQVARLFERGDKRRWRLEAARALSSQTEAQLKDTVRLTELTISTAFIHMLIAKEAVELSQASLTDFQHEVTIGNDRYTAGDLSRLDFLRLDLQLGGFESDQATNRIALEQAALQLQTLAGIAQPTADFDITGAIVPPPVLGSEQTFETAALAARPDLAAATFGVAVADANARLAIANGTTDPTLEAEYDRSGPESSAGFSVNIPLRFFDRNQGNKAVTRFQASAAQLTVVAARNQVVSDVRQAWVGYTQARMLSDRFGTHYLDESRDVLGIAQFAFNHGGLALIEYLDALRSAREATSDALNAYQQTWLAVYQLSAASGNQVTP